MDYNRTNIIAALATTPGMSAISIIRISGKDLTQLFKKITGKTEIKDRYAGYCSILENNQILDKCIVIYFASPKSYTGEDIIEINCHGGNIISKSILNMLYTHDVKPAHPGEFSYRAFLNNKMDLMEAEGIASLINSSSQYSSNIILDSLNSSLKKNILSINNKILQILAVIEHELDFSEEEISHVTNKTILKDLKFIIQTVQNYLARQNLVRIINNGINVVIMGVPNAGKSSLFNKLIGYNRTVVSSEKGTTRDSVEVQMLIEQYPVNLIDTAGYFKATNNIDCDSIKQSINYGENADIIIYLDKNNPKQKFKELNLTDKKIIYCKSKQDHSSNNSPSQEILNISSKTSRGIDSLYKRLSTLLSTDYNYNYNKDCVLISDRQIKIFQNALVVLNDIQDMLKNDIGMDVVASYVREVTALFDECLGKVTNEDVLNSIFSGFCVGK